MEDLGQYLKSSYFINHSLASFKPSYYINLKLDNFTSSYFNILSLDITSKYCLNYYHKPSYCINLGFDRHNLGP